MSERGWAVATLLFGAGALAMIIVFALLPEMRAASACLPPGSVVQFELARGSADLATLFGAPDAPCRPLAVAAMDAVNRLDMLAFIPLYTAFCVGAALLLAGGAVRPLAAAGALFALLAAAADYVETTTLLKITGALDDPSALEFHLLYLSWGAWSKFALLAAHAFACAGLCWVGERRRPMVGVLLLAPALGTAMAAFDHYRFANVMNAAFAAAWLALFVVALMEVMRKRS